VSRICTTKFIGVAGDSRTYSPKAGSFQLFLRQVERIRPKTQIERFIEAAKVGELSEWSCDGVFKRLAEGKMNSSSD